MKPKYDHNGTPQTKSYYDSKGWTESDDGQMVDNILWNPLHVGPLQTRARKLRLSRIQKALKGGGESLQFLECGCGANPQNNFFDRCHDYTGTDFSSSGLSAARAQLKTCPIPWRLVKADACKLPFADNSFDAVYSAHMLYHITNPISQSSAMAEMGRVTKTGGVIVLIGANPRPLLFLIRLGLRLIADAPILGRKVNGLRSKFGYAGPVPYNPQLLGWMRHELESIGDVEIISSGLASIWFKKKIDETTLLGGLIWRTLNWLEADYPHLSAWLGNYVQITVKKRQCLDPNDPQFPTCKPCNEPSRN